MSQKKKSKKGRGRPRLPEAERKPDLTITVRTSPEELAAWRAAAGGVPLRTWIREVLNRAR